MESDITLVTIGDINVSWDVVDCSKIGQRCFGGEKMRITHSKYLGDEKKSKKRMKNERGRPNWALGDNALGRRINAQEEYAQKREI